MPLSTLQATPRDVPSKTRGQDGFATSFPVGLLHPYNMPVYPGALRVARDPGTIRTEHISEMTIRTLGQRDRENELK
jgi:hypothetical protein